MQCKEGKPLHSFTEYFYIIPNEWANKSNQKYICQACMNAVERDFALQDDSMKITNTKRYCANHLRDCSYFAIKYSPEQIHLILDKNHSTSVSTSSNSLASNYTSVLKKQSTLSQYIGCPLHASKIPKFERLILRATVSVETLVTKNDAASDNDLKLPADIKVTINCDSFWDSLITLHKILHPFCGALDLMQRDKAHLYNWLHNSGAAPELSHVTCQLFGICITTASVERLFSTMGFLHSPLRNKLKEELLIDEEFEEDSDNLDNADIDFLDLEIHPTENQAA
ncbi:13253_t:CDS:2, partial [Cetraspora pellucida]